jgi:hypothetical protein
MYSNKIFYHLFHHYYVILILAVSLQINNLVFNRKIFFLCISILSLTVKVILYITIPLLLLIFSIVSSRTFLFYLLHLNSAMVTVLKRNISTHILNFQYHLFVLVIFLYLLVIKVPK